MKSFNRFHSALGGAAGGRRFGTRSVSYWDETRDRLIYRQTVQIVFGDVANSLVGYSRDVVPGAKSDFTQVFSQGERLLSLVGLLRSKRVTRTEVSPEPKQ